VSSYPRMHPASMIDEFRRSESLIEEVYGNSRHFATSGKVSSRMATAGWPIPAHQGLPR
jgi:hypothetical protein